MKTTITLWDPAQQKLVSLTVEQLCQALWVAQAQLCDAEMDENPDWPEASCWSSFEDLLGYSQDSEMYLGHSEAMLEASKNREV